MCVVCLYVFVYVCGMCGRLYRKVGEVWWEAKEDSAYE